MPVVTFPSSRMLYTLISSVSYGRLVIESRIDAETALMIPQTCPADAPADTNFDVPLYTDRYVNRKPTFSFSTRNLISLHWTKNDIATFIE